ncbi:MAG: cysteine desulfurase [Chitinophagaceae bacterium]|nr:MAG: cysteine desulfurase [Chitinophagaceae bacterium]
MNLDVQAIRSQFPILNRKVKDKPLVYFDNAATAQKPQSVIDALVHYYSQNNANVHRGIHSLAEEATADMEATRDTVRSFINAASREEIVFTKGTTESINLVAYTWGLANIHEGDEIIVSGMEHHSNLVPWQIVCQRNGGTIHIIPVDDQGEIIFEEFEKLLSPKTKLVSIVHASNSLGTINPVKEVIAAAKKHGAITLVDGAQSAVHLNIDVQGLDCDFFACSSHKLYGPTGVGVLYGRKEILEAMPAFNGGGEMISEVTYQTFKVNQLPYKFEAGTPNIADIVAFKAAIDFISQIGKENAHQWESQLLTHATAQLSQIPGVKLIGTAAQKVAVNSFIIEGIHPQDIGILLDNKGIAVRTGNHCTEPLMNRFKIPGTIRASYAVYNTLEEIDYFIASLQKAIKILS